MPNQTRVVVFPFDLFGGEGTGAGAKLLGDAVREILDDTDAEQRETRQHSFAAHVEIGEQLFETLKQLKDWREVGREVVRRVGKRDEFVLWLGGNHLSVMPIYEDLGADSLVVQFDAHLDCHRLHDCTEELNHGNFLFLLAESSSKGPKIVNVGSRDLFQTKRDWKSIFSEIHSIEKIAADIDAVAKSLASQVAKRKKVWIDIDVDVFDPSFAPGVVQASPFGLDPLRFWKLFTAAWCDRVVGVSISEFAPSRDDRDKTLELLGWLIERVLLLRYE